MIKFEKPVFFNSSDIVIFVLVKVIVLWALIYNQTNIKYNNQMNEQQLANQAVLCDAVIGGPCQGGQ